ncbi:TetR/AcrR family transcriptional regulator [Comamonadaceae bacterium G21597-S1]|nr:TetR/AcrR family transcriptional regulator [Comamonadaceae bacterium G21597-S1]
MKPARKPGKPIVESSRLTRDDWLDAAFQAVVDGGFDKVRVLVLADALGVTRGSFYWHFADHAELLSALLARWHAREVAVNQALAAPRSTDPRTDLEHLLESVLAHAGADLENMRFELALRGLGRRDPAVARMLAEVDAQRMALFTEKFLRYTGDETKSTELAVLFYLAIVGSYQALSRPKNPPQIKALMQGIIARYLIEQQGPR